MLYFICKLSQKVEKIKKFVAHTGFSKRCSCSCYFNCSHEFIENLPKVYDTLIGEGGVYLSDGEEQRVSVAMAILKNSPILVLDEVPLLKWFSCKIIF